ncbi:hypothetical protein C8A00DRAFT_38653 [Chaetomidium leptoderma]|uniref:Uncharacterized protein n=1 Tax=Chaetomidium leptoderma TaxID=669021 RepID=A0AAN6ZSN4_9PEZI|nr:hypothetical protein C8A00DRAFT_38653 [Chaetomidium leptoderma]
MEDIEGKREGGLAGNFVLLYAQTNPETFHYALLAFFKGAVDEWVQGFQVGERTCTKPPPGTKRQYS